MNEYSDTAAKKGAEVASGEFYKNNNVWITKLDQYGRISEVENYYIEVKSKNGTQAELRIPMYSFQGEYSFDLHSLLRVGDQVAIDMVNIGDESIPYQIQTAKTGVVNMDLANKLKILALDEDSPRDFTVESLYFYSDINTAHSGINKHQQL